MTCSLAVTRPLLARRRFSTTPSTIGAGPTRGTAMQPYRSLPCSVPGPKLPHTGTTQRVVWVSQHLVHHSVPSHPYTQQILLTYPMAQRQDGASLLAPESRLHPLAAPDASICRTSRETSPATAKKLGWMCLTDERLVSRRTRSFDSPAKVMLSIRVSGLSPRSSVCKVAGNGPVMAALPRRFPANRKISSLLTPTNAVFVMRVI